MATNQITVEIDNKTLTGWESIEINDDMEQLGNDFTLTSNIPSKQDFGITRGQSIIIRIDGEKKLTGYIDKIRKTENASSSQMVITGRDKVSDFVDSRVSNKTFIPPIGFVEMLKKLLVKVGYEIISVNSLSQPLQSFLSTNKISIVDNYTEFEGQIPIFQTNEGIAFSSGESAYSLIKRLADKRGILLGTDGDGNITIDAIGKKFAITGLQRLEKDLGQITNNIIEANLDDGMESLFYSYTIASVNGGDANANLSASDKEKTDSEKAFIDPINNNISYSATIYSEDKSIRKTRNFYAVVPNLNNEQCKERAIWECNIRKAKSFIYTCKVSGFRQSLTTTFQNNELNPLWDINTKVYVNDERFVGVDGEYLIRAVKYKQSISEGSICELTLVDQNSYTYSLFEPKVKKGKKPKGNLLFTDGGLV